MSEPSAAAEPPGRSERLRRGRGTERRHLAVVPTVLASVLLTACSSGGTAPVTAPVATSSRPSASPTSSRTPVAADHAVSTAVRSAASDLLSRTNAVLTPQVRADAASVVRITGVASACSRIQEGSGFVVAPGRVVTNSHVVQGLSSERVMVAATGRSYAAVVVLYDPAIDLAVLAVPGLHAPALPVATGTLGSGAGVVAAGFPLDGPFRLSRGHVDAVALEAGPQVGSTRPQARQVYVLTISVRPGNSGGPLLDPQGDVVGIVFARSQTSATTGYAITAAGAQPVLAAAAAADVQVGTGTCSAG